MASALKNLSEFDPNHVPTIENAKVGIAFSEYHHNITSKLLEGCLETLQANGLKEAEIDIHLVPGAFELPISAQLLAETDSYDAIICIGCVIKGDTAHDLYINTAIAQGITQVSLDYNLPVAFGVLTPNTEQQAIDRSGGKHGNKGVEIAVATLKMLDLARKTEEMTTT